jgi:eukaryotic-like serine/threonine-protein kinase
MPTTDGQLLNNRYRLIARVASGGMAVVYKAQDTMLGRIVAVKILRESFAEDPSFQARFQREAQAAANLSHPNIVTVHDFGLDGDKQYIVMEYVEGSDLKQLIQQGAPFSPQRMVDLSIQICAAVGAAHRANVVHCDVKPQNVLVTPEGRAKVTDFGIARALSGVSAGGVTTGVWGTPHYFSPEQAAGSTPSPASDVYSIGVIMYEMLTGRLPFEGDNQQQLAMAHMRDQPPPISKFNSKVPAQLEQIVNRALAKEPSQRYRTADQLGRLLYEYQRNSEQATGYQRPMSLTGSISSSMSQPLTPERGGFDWTFWLLLAVAAIAVIGLFPVSYLAYNKVYGGPRIPSTPTASPAPTVTPTIAGVGQQTTVPNLSNRKKDEAQQLLADAGLQMAIKEERNDPKLPAGTILEQSPAPGTPAQRGDVVNVVVSKGPPTANVVSVVGLLGRTSRFEMESERSGWAYPQPGSAARHAAHQQYAAHVGIEQRHRYLAQR